MEETPPKNPLSVLRVCFVLGAGWIIGTIAGMVVSFNRPAEYLTSAFVSSPAHAGHAERLTPLRTEMTSRILDLENRWNTTFQQAAANVARTVSLKPSGDGVEIVVITPDPKDSQMIAETVAAYLDTPEREKEMAVKTPHVQPYSEAEIAELGDLLRLEEFLDEQAAKESFENYFAVLKEADAGNHKAVELKQDEDFSRRWNAVEKMSKEIGYYNPPGEPFRAPNVALRSTGLSLAPLNSVDALMNRSRLAGLAAAGLVLAALFRWKSGFLHPSPPRPPAKPRKRVVNEDDPW